MHEIYVKTKTQLEQPVIRSATDLFRATAWRTVPDLVSGPARRALVHGLADAPQAPKAKYCSEDCRRRHEQDRAKEARRKGTKPKRDSVDRYLAPTGPAHDEIMAMRREVAMKY